MSALLSAYSREVTLPRASSPNHLHWWPTPAELGHALRRRRGAAFALGTLGGVLAAAAVWLSMPAGQHEAQALLQVKPDATRSGPDPEFEGYKQTQLRLLRSHGVLERVAADPAVARRSDGNRVQSLEAAIRVRWESPELLAVTMTGDDEVLLRAALDVLVAEYLREAATEDEIGRLKQRREIERRLATAESASSEARESLQQELVRLDLADRAGPRVVRREAAAVVLNRNLSRKTARSGGAFVAGWLLLLATVALTEWQRRRVDSARQLADRLGLPILDSPRTALLHAIAEQSLQVVAVCDAERGEGAPALAERLAAELAATGLRTVLLHCDPHGSPGTLPAPGCGELLVQEVDLAEAVRPAGVPNLWVVPPGERSDRVTAALAQGHPLKVLLQQLRRQFDLLVIDAGPVLPGVDAALVGRHTDGVVLSVHRDVSRLPSVRAAADTLARQHVPVIGVVVGSSDSARELS